MHQINVKVGGKNFSVEWDGQDYPDEQQLQKIVQRIRDENPDKKLKPASEVTALVVDNGHFFELARTLARTYKKVYLYNNNISEAPKMDKFFMGYGYEEIECVGSIYGEHYDKADAVIFPDVGQGSEQVKIAKEKPVWGCRMAEALELDREWTKKFLKKIGMPVGPFEVVMGIEELRKFLKEHKDYYVKISRWRGCFDEHTEILTQRGWLKFDNLDKEDRVATMDVNTKNMCFMKPDAHIKYWHSGEMIKINARGVNALVTPNHKFWIKSRLGGYSGKKVKTSYDAPWRYASIGELKDRIFHIPATCKWTGVEAAKYMIPVVFKKTNKKPINIDMDIWLEFLGWFISEGCICLSGKDKDSYRTIISQSFKKHPENSRLIREVMGKIGIHNIQREGVIGYSIFDKSLYMELERTCYTSDVCDCGKRHCCHKKKVPDYIKELTPRQIKIFLDSYFLGDGGSSKSKNTTMARYYTSSKKLADNIQELLIKTGINGRITSRIKNGGKVRGRLIKSARPQYVVTERRTNCPSIAPQNIKTEQFEGYVYDVTVSPFHSILVRRSGIPYWSGNSFESFLSSDYLSIDTDIDSITHRLGMMKYIQRFVCEKALPDKVELGMDCYTVNGEWPSKCLGGIEKKDAGYGGSVRKWKDFPRPVTELNEKFSPYLKEMGMCGNISTEGRIGEDHKFFNIDNTLRRPSPPGELMQEIYKNEAEIIWQGANGVLVDPEEAGKFGLQVNIKSGNGRDGEWQEIEYPKEFDRNVKLHNACIIKGRKYIIPTPWHLEEIGGIVAWGNSFKEAEKMLKEVAEQVKGPTLIIDTESVVADVEKELEKSAALGLAMVP